MKGSKKVECVVIRKSGGFYNVFDDDAIIVSYLTNYKIVGGRCGFPINSLNKVTNLLDNNSINYVVRDNMEDIEKKNFKKKNKYKIMLEKVKKKFNIDYRINYILNKINELSYDKLCSLLGIIEDYIDE